MSQTYILDTNVLLSDPKSLFYFEEHSVVIPVQCIEELDRFKKERISARGAAARTVSRYLDKLRSRGSLMTGVPLTGGGTLRVEFEGSEESGGLGAVDNSIISLAKSMTDRGDNVTLVSRDTNMRIKADVLGVQAEDYKHDNLTFDTEDEFAGFVSLDAGPSDIDALFADGHLEIEQGGLLPRQFAVMKDSANRSALCVVNGRADELKLINSKDMRAWGIAPRSKEQCFALEALLDPDIPLVTLSGKAGTGKTLVALAAGLQNTCDDKLYRKVLVARPMISMGKEVGYLPGSLEDKLKPWMQPIFDNLEILLGTSDGSPKYSYLLDRNIIQVEALSFIRGRSIPHQYMIIDEAQNLTPHEAKTILTRAGEGAKIIMTGDPAQIDNPYVDHRSNGLSYVIESFKNSPYAAHITLTKGERSDLADEAARLL